MGVKNKSNSNWPAGQQALDFLECKRTLQTNLAGSCTVICNVFFVKHKARSSPQKLRVTRLTEIYMPFASSWLGQTTPHVKRKNNRLSCGVSFAEHAYSCTVYDKNVRYIYIYIFWKSMYYYAFDIIHTPRRQALLQYETDHQLVALCYCVVMLQ